MADPQNFSDDTDDEMVSAKIESPLPAERKEQKELSVESRNTTYKQGMSIKS